MNEYRGGRGGEKVKKGRRKGGEGKGREGIQVGEKMWQ